MMSYKKALKLNSTAVSWDNGNQDRGETSLALALGLEARAEFKARNK